MITVADRLKYPNCDDNAIQGIKLISQINDDSISIMIESIVNKDYKYNVVVNALYTLLGNKGKYVNTAWMLGRVIDEAYSRNLIDERKMDYLNTQI